MIRKWPTSSNEAEKKIAWVQGGLDAKTLSSLKTGEIQAALLWHIAQLNPDLAEIIKSSPADEHVLYVVWQVSAIARGESANEDKFMVPMVDDSFWPKQA
jgi:hypothetical protein